MCLQTLPIQPAAARYMRSLPQMISCLKASFVFFLLFIVPSARSQWSGTNPIYYNGGNVGIGTANPNSKLQVSGGQIAATVDDGLSGFVQLWNDNAVIWKQGNVQGGLRFGSATSLGAANWSEKMRITDKGRLGIGTATPVSALHVVAPDEDPNSWGAFFSKPRLATVGAYVYTFENVGGILANNIGPFWRGFHFAAPHITVGGQNTWPRLAIFSEFNSFTDPTMKKWVIQAANSSVPLDIQFLCDNTSLMYLKSNGNVGIGTDAPGTYKLAVEGKIGARRVIVTQNAWADYVFDSTYHLRPLSQVEQFIKTNKHLPEVPSSAEVNSHGLDLGDNQATLLKKIEELTLYLIDQNKKLEEQGRTLERQQHEIIALKKQISRKE